MGDITSSKFRKFSQAAILTLKNTVLNGI